MRNLPVSEADRGKYIIVFTFLLVFVLGFIACAEPPPDLPPNPELPIGMLRPPIPPVGSFLDDWTYLGVPMGDYYVQEIAVDREDDRILYTNSQRGLYVSHDGGLSWKLAVAVKYPGSDGGGGGVIAQDPHTVDRVFYGRLNELHVSIDRGLTWKLVSKIDSTVGFKSLVVSNLDPHTIYSGTVARKQQNQPKGMFYRSEDDGVTWQTFPYCPPVSMYSEDIFLPWALAEDPVCGILYIGGEVSRYNYFAEIPGWPFLRSIDGGETWEDIDPGLGIAVKIIIDPDSSNVFVKPEGNYVWLSTDFGLTWRRVSNSGVVPHGSFARDHYRADTFYSGLHAFQSPVTGKLVANGGALISTDGAETWNLFGLDGFAVDSPVLNGDASRLFVVSFGTGIFSRPLP